MAAAMDPKAKKIAAKCRPSVQEPGGNKQKHSRIKEMILAI